MQATKYKVNEIFYSIQAEGFYAGTPAIFIRFSGCNLQCPWCDTKYHDKGEYYTKEELEKIVYNLIPKYQEKRIIIVFTGGEPTMQLKENEELFKGLYRTVETNGLLPVPTWIDWVTCSPKTDIKFKQLPNEIKVVYEPKREQYYKNLLEYDTMLFMQPLEENGIMNTRETINFIKEYPKFRFSLQYHKLIGVR